MTKLYKPMIGFIILFIYLIQFTPASADNEEPITLLYRLNDGEDAVLIAEEYALEVIYISRFNLVEYAVTKMTDVPLLLAMGFTINQTHTIHRPPWLPRPGGDLTDRQYALEMMNVFEAWEVAQNNLPVTVAVIDSGIELTHPEFAGRILPTSYNSHRDTVGTDYVHDDIGHGTAVAGVIAAAKDQVGVTGIAPNANLLVIKANHSDASMFTDASLINAIYYAIEQGVDVINMSLGGFGNNRYIEEAVNEAHERGIFVVVSAGNNATDTPNYPAAFTHTISVSAVNQDAELAYFSSFGETINITAPGEAIYTTTMNGGYGAFNGTSFSAPQVSGILALMIAHYGSLDYYSLLNILYDSAVPKEPEIYFGVGMANAYQALTADLIQIRFETFMDERLTPIFMERGQTLSMPYQPIKEGYYFTRWYFDEHFENPWTPETIMTSSATLYARFVEDKARVRLFDGDVLLETLTIIPGTEMIFDPMEKAHYSFAGWYLDEALTVPWQNQRIYYDIDLYARYTANVYQMTFYDFDRETVIATKNFRYDETVELPVGLETFEDDFFTWQFIKWDFEGETLTEDIAVFPLYTRTFKTEMVSLEIGVDTLRTGDQWHDEGVVFDASPDPSFVVTVDHEVNTAEAGEYRVDYRIYEGEALLIHLVRYVHVLPQIEIELRLNAGITTLVQGQDYEDAGAVTNYGVVTIIGEVNTDVPGRYVIVYRVEYDGVTAVKTRVVHVLPKDTPTLWWPQSVRKKEADYDVV